MKIISTLVLVFCLQSMLIAAPKTDHPKAKYVFYFIGDGMGEAHVNLTEAYLAALQNEIGIRYLNLSTFPVLGFQATHATDQYITDSAASGTALATGKKTSVGTIGMADNHKDSLYSIAYAAKDAGMKVGVLSSVSINHATPSSFYAYQPSRNDYYKIALQLPISGFDVFGGGGFNYPTGKLKTPKPDAYKHAQELGYTHINTKKAFKKLKPSDSKILMTTPDVLAQGEMPFAMDRTEDMLNLADFTGKAIELLDNPQGFFLMVEGGKIDWAGHANDAAAVVHEVIDFDKAIKVAVDFYKKHPEETLIVITADHETGGLALGNSEQPYQTDFALLEKQKGSLTIFNQEFNEFVNQDSVHSLTFENILEIGENFFGITKDDLSEQEKKDLETAFGKYRSQRRIEKLLYNNVNAITAAWLKIFNAKAGIGWISNHHTGIPVPVRALGTQATQFDGFYDNTDIPKKIAEIMGVKMTN